MFSVSENGDNYEQISKVPDDIWYEEKHILGI